MGICCNFMQKPIIMTTPEKKFDCCPPFNPEPWNDKSFSWKNKQFVKGKVKTFFYMPIGFGKEMQRLDKKISDAGTSIADNLGLSDHTSKWNMDVYLAVDKPVPGEENLQMSGNFYSRVYEGPFSDTGKWHKDFVENAKQKGLTTGKTYMWYTTCPKCAKKYGKNYTVILAEVV